MQFKQLTAAIILQLATLTNTSPVDPAAKEAVAIFQTRQDPGAINACYQGVTAQVNACYSACGVRAGCYVGW